MLPGWLVLMFLGFLLGMNIITVFTFLIFLVKVNVVLAYK